MILFNILIFIASCLALIFAGKWLIDALSRVAKFLSLKEFIVAFFIMSVGTSIPNLMIGIISAINKIPELSFGDVMGANLFDLSIVMGLAALFSRGGLGAQSRTVQESSIFSIIIAVLPIFLILDGNLSRIDGILLLLSFVFYISWAFSKKERFAKTYDHQREEKIGLRNALKSFGIILGGLALLLAGGQGIVTSASFFSQEFNIPLGIIGIFVVAISTCLPETFFTIHAARCGHDWLILGNLMGSVVITTTLVLGIVAIIQPIQIDGFSSFAIARIFLVIAAAAFIFFVRSGQKITKNEGLFLIFLYVAFAIATILFK